MDAHLGKGEEAKSGKTKRGQRRSGKAKRKSTFIGSWGMPAARSLIKTGIAGKVAGGDFLDSVETPPIPKNLA